MTAKQTARKVINSLPPKASMEDIMHALYIREMFERGLREVREGKGTPHSAVKKRFQKWVK